ncbi:MAG: hypothetical protein JXB10_10235 [Pirellulales bacterium]|nr:hypothetical protein [Pirellulales bacterium]
MSKHELTVKMPERKIERADVEFGVKVNGKKIGTLKVSQGGIEWKKGKQKGIHRKWTEFDTILCNRT